MLLFTITASLNVQASDLIEAVNAGDLERVRICIAQGAKVNLQNKDGLFSLMFAALKGHAETVKVLITAGAKVNLQNKDGYSSLMGAALNGHAETVKVLIAAGAEVNLQNKDGFSSLMCAAQNGHAETVKVLMTAGAEVNLQKKDGVSSLMLAAQNGHAEIVKVLITAGAEVNLQNKDGASSLMVAVLKGHAETVKVLIAAGAKVNLQDKGGVSSLIFAALKGHAETVKVLVAAGAEVNLQNKDGVSSLMCAAQNGHAEIVKVLITAGADTNVLMPNGESILMAAVRIGSADIVQSLVRNPLTIINLQNKADYFRLVKLLALDDTVTISHIFDSAVENNDEKLVGALLSVGVRSDLLSSITGPTLIPDREENCPICCLNLNCEQYVEELPEASIVVLGQPAVLECSGRHQFHTECIQSALRYQRTCPTCRTQIARPSLSVETIDTLFVQIEQEIKKNPFVTVPSNQVGVAPASDFERDFLMLPFRLRDQLRELQKELRLDVFTVLSRKKSAAIAQLQVVSELAQSDVPAQEEVSATAEVSTDLAMETREQRRDRFATAALQRQLELQKK